MKLGGRQSSNLIDRRKGNKSDLDLLLEADAQPPTRVRGEPLANETTAPLAYAARRGAAAVIAAGARRAPPKVTISPSGGATPIPARKPKQRKS
jgi:hypothetical protein